jgi:PIN domain nuclease of toxin-antitoxin system
MRCLLDTHALLWWISTPEVLPPPLRDLLDDRSNELLLSIATPWELAIKTNFGKLDAGQILRDIENGQLKGDVEILLAQLSHVIRAGMLPLHHRDPFDRLLAAQALDLRIPLVSRDRVFDAYGVQRIWD